MASFSVDITDIKFAGGRTGYKVVTISNAPSGGISISNTGYGTYFRLRIQESNRYYQIETKGTNTSGTSRTSNIRFYNTDDSSDYVVVDIEQYSVSDIAIYGDNIYSSGSVGFYGLDVDYNMGSASVYIDSYNGEGVSGSVVSGSSWLSCVSSTPAITDTGFIGYNISYTKNIDSSRSGEVYFETGTSHYNLTLTVNQAGGAPVEVLSVSPSSLSFTAAGGTKAIDVIQYRGSTLNYDMTEVSSWASISLSQVMTGVMTGSVTTAVNASTAQRTGSIWFSDVSGSISLPIVQGGQAVTLSASPSSLSFTSNGGTKTLAVTFAGDLNSNAANMPSWLAQSYVSVDSTHRTYTVRASSNNTVSSRNFSWVFQDDNMELTVPVTQAAGAVPSIVLSPSNGSVTSGSWYVQVLVSGPAAQDVTYSISGSSWVSFRNIDGQYFRFNYSSNTSAAPRTATITFSAPGYTSATYTLNQAGAESSALIVSPSSVSVSDRGTSLYVSVSTPGGSTPSGLSYSVSDSWVSVSSLYITISRNFSPDSRTATVTFSAPGYDSAVFTVYQEGMTDSGVVFTPDVIEFDYLGGNNVGDFVWISGNRSFKMYPRVVGNIPMAVPSSSYVGAGSSTFSFKITEGTRNDTYNNIEGKIEFYTAQTGGYKVGEIQMIMKAAPHYLSVVPDVLSWSRNVLIPVYVSAVGSVTVTAPEWLNVQLYGEYSTYKEYRISPIGSNSNQGYIVFSSGGDSVVVYGVFNYSGSVTLYNHSIEPNPLVFPLSGGTKSLMVSSRWADSNPSLLSFPSWISDVYGNYTSDDNKRHYLYRFRAEDTVSSRSGTSTIRIIYDDGSSVSPVQRDYNITIQQSDGVLSTVPEVLYFTVSGGSNTFTVRYTGDLVVDLSSLPSWLRVTESSSSTGEKTYSVVADYNNGAERAHHIVFQDDNYMIAFPIIQAGSGSPGSPLTVSPSILSINSTGGSGRVTVSGGTGQVVLNSGSFPSWLSISSVGGGVYEITAVPNTSIVQRSFSVLFTDETPSTVTVDVYQAGLSPDPPVPVVVSGGLRASKDRVYTAQGYTDRVYLSGIKDGGFGYTIEYEDGSGWCSVSTGSDYADVSRTGSNNGPSRTGKIKFYQNSDPSDYVYVMVFDISDTISCEKIWEDLMVVPDDAQVGEDYHYRIDTSDGTVFSGVTVAKSDSDYCYPINIARIVENYVTSDKDEWKDSIDAQGWVDVYPKRFYLYNTDYDDVAIGQYDFWPDWDDVYYGEGDPRMKICYAKTLNDPINSKGCSDMLIPFMVYDDNLNKSYSIIWNTGSKILSGSGTGSYFKVYTKWFNDVTGTVLFKRGDDVVMSYDMNHCGQGYLIYRNRFGGWDSFLIEGNIIKKEDYARESYSIKKYSNTSNNRYLYGDKIVDRVDIDTVYEFSTGWLSDDESARFVYHLLSSPSINLVLFDNQYDIENYYLPVNIINTEAEYKKFRNGKRLVNYTITVSDSNKKKVQR